MLKIKTMQDIKRLQYQKFLPPALLQELERYFKELCESLTGEPDAWRSHSLEVDGPIVVLRPTDDPISLKEHGIDPAGEEAFLVGPEFTSLVELNDGSRYYKTVVVLDNSCAVAIFTPLGVWNNLDDYLSEYLVD